MISCAMVDSFVKKVTADLESIIKPFPLVLFLLELLDHLMNEGFPVHHALLLNFDLAPDKVD